MRAFVERASLTPTLSNKGYIHVAGTNGKGTTTAFVESILRHQGWRTGAFYSPYVVDYRERIQAEGQMIAPDELAALVARLLPVADSMGDTEFGGATKFELEAAMGFAYWEQKACEWVALEVGLGGRLDATNVVTPKACIIVSVGLDHTSILGNSLEEIAAEKAGIIKPGVPVVVGEMPPEAYAVIKGIAKERSAPFFSIERQYAQRDGIWQVGVPGGIVGGFQPTLAGEKIGHNMALAVVACFVARAIKDSGEALAEGVRNAWLPGRNDVREVAGHRVIFDGAHNADAARILVKSLPDKIRLVSNMLSGHEAEPFYREFVGRAVGVEVAPIDSPRAMRVEDTVAMLQRESIPSRGHATVRAALQAAIAADDAPVVVCGSNYLVGDALRAID
jgi:dihydrofolate synthase/folylpolyglutamate synthase